MYTQLDVKIEQPATINSKITDYYRYIQSHLEFHLGRAFSDDYFGKESKEHCLGNDFTYLLGLLLLVYEQTIVIENNGETLDIDSIYEAFYLNDAISYFIKVHDFNIEPLFAIFGLLSGECTIDTILKGTTEVDLDCLI